MSKPLSVEELEEIARALARLAADTNSLIAEFGASSDPSESKAEARERLQSRTRALIADHQRLARQPFNRSETRRHLANLDQHQRDLCAYREQPEPDGTPSRTRRRGRR